MNHMRSLIGIVLAFAIAAFAIPGIAGNKTFNLAATPSVAVNQSIDVTFTNSDDGNSSFNSIKFTGEPASGTTLVISNVVQTGSAKPGAPVITRDNTTGKTSVLITDLSPIKPGKSLKVTLTVQTTTGNCTSGSIQWRAQSSDGTGGAWTGSPSTPSNPFNTSDSPTTTISAPSCGVTIDRQPTRALKNQLITSAELDPTAAKVKVSVTVNGGAPQSPTNVTLTPTCTSGSMTPALYVKTMDAGSSSVEFDTLKSSTVATGCTLKATTSALPSTYEVTSDSFNVVDANLVITTSLPNGFALGSPTTITAVLQTTDKATVPQSGIGLLTVSAACTPTSVSATTTNGVLSFDGVEGATNGGKCTLTASATFNGVEYTSVAYGPFAVYQKSSLDCASTPPADSTGVGYFASLPSGVSSVTDVGYAAGYRARNDKSAECLKVNYTFTNNIGTLAAPGTLGATDALGNTLPQNSASFVWPEGYQPQAVFTYTLTFQPEYVGKDSGLPVKKTKFCKVQKDGSGNLIPTDCTVTGNQEFLKACTSTALTAASIPGTDPACIAGEMWTTVAATQCSTLENPNGTGLPPACVVVTTRIIDARDPPIIR